MPKPNVTVSNMALHLNMKRRVAQLGMQVPLSVTYSSLQTIAACTSITPNHQHKFAQAVLMTQRNS